MPSTPLPALRDQHIRHELRTRLQYRFGADADTLIIDEFSLPKARIDIAVVNGSMHGFEIKSEADTLDRLFNQIPAYSAVFDRVTVVTAKRHVDALMALVPAWWGISIAAYRRTTITIRAIRAAGRNNDRDATQLAQLLWRKEALTILRDQEWNSPLYRATAAELRALLVSRCDIAQIAAAARKAIKQRQRCPWQQIAGGGSYTTGPTAQDYRRNFEWLLSLRSQSRRR